MQRARHVFWGVRGRGSASDAEPREAGSAEIGSPRYSEGSESRHFYRRLLLKRPVEALGEFVGVLHVQAHGLYPIDQSGGVRFHVIDSPGNFTFRTDIIAISHGLDPLRRQKTVFPGSRAGNTKIELY
jgi:hypothetical protein